MTEQTNPQVREGPCDEASAAAAEPVRFATNDELNFDLDKALAEEDGSPELLVRGSEGSSSALAMSKVGGIQLRCAQPSSRSEVGSALLMAESASKSNTYQEDKFESTDAKDIRVYRADEEGMSTPVDESMLKSCDDGALKPFACVVEIQQIDSSEGKDGNTLDL